MPFVGNEAAEFFNAAMQSEIPKLVAVAESPLSQYQATFVKLIQHFPYEFWSCLVRAPAPTIAQVLGPPLNLDPKAVLITGQRPFELCRRGTQVREFHGLGIDMSPLWSSTLRSGSPDVVMALLDIGAELPALSEVLKWAWLPRAAIGRVVQACLLRGATPSTEDFQLAVRNQHSDVIDLFTMMGIGVAENLRPKFPRYVPLRSTTIFLDTLDHSLTLYDLSKPPWTDSQDSFRGANQRRLRRARSSRDRFSTRR
jgi:hypothetical protein